MFSLLFFRVKFTARLSVRSALFSNRTLSGSQEQLLFVKTTSLFEILSAVFITRVATSRLSLMQDSGTVRVLSKQITRLPRNYAWHVRKPASTDMAAYRNSEVILDKLIAKLTYPRNRSWRPIRFWDVGKDQTWPPLWSSGQSSWLQNGEVLWFLWGTNWIYIGYVEKIYRLCSLVVRVPGCRTECIVIPVRYELNL
jgi:hypothetical protein